MPKRDFRSRFSDADATGDPQELVNYLDDVTASTSYKRQTYALLQAKSGIGCSTLVAVQVTTSERLLRLWGMMAT